MVAKTSALIIVLAAACAACGDVLPLEECSARSNDAFSLGDLAIAHDELRVHVTTAGGCASHSFSACWDGTATKSDPPQVSISLFHDADGDTCDGLLTFDLRVDVSRVRANYRPPVVLHVSGATSQIAGTTNSVTLPP